jgi:hypothetical protein
MSPELSTAIACATAVRGQLQSDIAATFTPDKAALSKAIDQFLTAAFSGRFAAREAQQNSAAPLKNRSGHSSECPKAPHSHAPAPEHSPHNS